MEPTDAIRRQQVGGLDLFAWLWACFSIFHQGKAGTWTNNPFEILMTAAAIVVIARPRYLPAFLILVCAQTASFVHGLPNITNHTILALIANVTILAAVLREAIRGFGHPIDKAALYATFAPVLRVEILILYFFVTFHKLNADFLLPEYSAAVEHYENLSATLAMLRLPTPPASEVARMAAIYGTLIIEGGIPLLLLFRPTRILGIWVGLLFHFMLSVEDYYDFSSMAYAMLSLFAPANFPTMLRQWWDGSRLRRLADRLVGSPPMRTIPPPVWIALVGIGIMAAFDVREERWSFRIFKILWVFYGAAVIAAFAGAIHSRRSEAPISRPGIFRFASAAFVIFPLLVFFNGACPYLGLKTRSVFAMFSNLRTEGGTTNHLIVPEWTQIAGYQRDMVLVEESSDPGLARLAERRMAIPFFNLRLMVSDRAARGIEGIRLVYDRGGRRIELENAERDPELARPPSYLERKLLIFGGINPGPHQVNRH